MSKNKYTNLLSNTVIFGISTFGSKLMVFALTPVITYYIKPDLMATAELVTSICNFVLPIMYLCIADSVIRFGMDQHYKRRDVFSFAIWTMLVGYLLFLCCYPLLGRIEDLSGYIWLVYLYCLSSAMRTIVTNFVRVSGFVRLFAIDGIITTISTLFFSLFLFIRMEDITGYVLGTVVADFLSAISLFLFLKLYRFLRIRGLDLHTAVDMFRYAIPLIPTAISWAITNLSDRFFVRYMVGITEQGVYGQAYKIPNLVTIVSAFVTRAWEMSAFSEYNSKESVQFFSVIFRSYYTLVFLMSSVLILLIKPFTSILLTDPAYYIAWRYAIFLLLAVALSCLVTFLGAIYNAAKRNIMLTVTTAIGALANLLLNALLIGPLGPEGAAIATFISFLLVFVIRLIDSRRYMPIDSRPFILTLSLLLLLVQALVGMYEVHLWVLWECLLLLALILLNSRQLVFLMRNGLSLLHRRRPASG